MWNLAAVWVMVTIGYIVRLAAWTDASWYTAISNFLPYLGYTDLGTMWQYRGLYLHELPYISGTFTPPSALGNGAVEYPVLSGVVMWITAAFSSSFGVFFFLSTVIAGVVGSVIGVLLSYLVGRWSLLWSWSPLLALYGSYNWDFWPVLAVLAGVAVMLIAPEQWSSRRRTTIAAVMFGIGCLFKLYPLMYVVPLGLSLFVHSSGALRRRVLEAIRPLLVALAVVVAGNLPFAILGFEGWAASFRFQGYRAVSSDTLSIWYWWLPGLHDESGFTYTTGLSTVTLVSSAVMLGGMLACCAWGMRRAQREGAFPWLQVSAAMTVAYMVLGKVDSPQYGVWLLPFLALVAVPLPLVIGYMVTNLALYSSYFTPGVLSALVDRNIILTVGVSLNVGVLTILAISFLRRPVRGPVLRYGDSA